MTLVMAWRAEGEGVWVVSDSRLTQGQSRLTDNAAKLLEIPIKIVRGPGDAALTMQFGFAYAGSSLVALEAYAAVLPLWSRLWLPFDTIKVRMADFASHLGFFVAAYAKSVGASTQTLPQCECLLIGHDLESSEIQAWRIRPVFDGPVIVPSCELLDLGSGKMEMSGSGSAFARSRLPSHEVWRREPLTFMREHLAADQQPDVGGGLQVGFAEGCGFNVLGDFVLNREAKRIDMTFRGHDFSNIGTVGPAAVLLPSVDGEILQTFEPPPIKAID
ncbi:MAG: hypothetical protein EBR82_02805 [Caulobacteraceae bacterium]|nr:hypothetical protein [Caulobacteraceae bacterium]